MTPGRGVVRLLLALSAGSLALALGLILAWTHSARKQVRLDDLGDAERRRLVEEELARVGTVYSAADFDPRVGYTFAPAQEVAGWGGRFRTNELGFRAGPVKKAPGVFRVVFVGDSWTFGLGESFGDSFPGQFERLAQGLVKDRRVEAWPLALPGYNVLNEAAALESIGPLLEPDAVVWCPTNNDVSSSTAADPRGFLTRRDEGEAEPFGDGMYREFTVRFINSYRYLARWRRAALEYGRAERRLRLRGIPLALLFTARWREPWPEKIISESGLTAAWAVALAEWNEERNRFNHGTPESYGKYARLAYRLVAADAPGWPELGPDSGASAIHRGALGNRGIEASTLGEPPGERRQLPIEFAPDSMAARKHEDRCFGTMDCATGRVGRRAAILLYRADGSRRLRVSLRRIESAPPGFYPITVELRIPREGGGTETIVEVPATGPLEVRASLDLPEDLEPGAAYELEIASDAAVLDPGERVLQSLQVVRVEPED